jgi:hypothetical protein
MKPIKYYLFVAKYYLECIFNILFSPFFYYWKKIIHVDKINTPIHKLNNNFKIVTLVGDYYQMGYQYGSLMKNDILYNYNLFENFLNYLESEHIKKIPFILKDKDIYKSLDKLYNRCESYIDENIKQFVRGMSKSSGVKERKIWNYNLYLSLMGSHCILYSTKLNNKLLHLRTLDYIHDNYKHNLIVFKPNNLKSYSSFYFIGLIFILTGINNNKIILDEVYYDEYLSESLYKSNPYYFKFHKILSESKNNYEAMKILKEEPRDGNLHIGVSDGNKNESVFLKYCRKFCEEDLILKYSPISSFPPNEKSKYDKLLSQKKYSVEEIIRLLSSMRTGEVHSFLYYDNYIYVSVTSNYIQSYNNDFYKIDLNSLF